MKFLGFLLLVLLLVAAVAGFLIYVPYGPTTETFVDIAPGTGTQSIAAQLQGAGIIRSQYAFDALKMVKGGRLKAGEYRFDHAAPVPEVYARIAKGDVYTRTLVIPEGYNIFDIAGAVEAAGLGSREAFLAAERSNTQLIAQVSPDAPSLEGFLFPDTYKFSRHASAADMLSVMVRRWTTMTASLHLAQGRDIARTVIMASLVEKEVKVDSERPMVAGVFENRLAKGMPLQTDPSVIYAALLDKRWSGTIHASDLKADSPYNTYRHSGLPPGPICNPGMAALRAAMAPTPTDNLYFVSDAAGHSKFASDLQEHQQNVRAYREATAK